MGPCKMMMAKGQKGKFLYRETDTYQSAALPYGDKGEYSAVLVLPRQDSKPTLTLNGSATPTSAKAPRAASLDDVLASAHSDWSSLSNMDMTEGNLSFPRF